MGESVLPHSGSPTCIPCAYTLRPICYGSVNGCTVPKFETVLRAWFERPKSKMEWVSGSMVKLISVPVGGALSLGEPNAERSRKFPRSITR